MLTHNNFTYFGLTTKFTNFFGTTIVLIISQPSSFAPAAAFAAATISSSVTIGEWDDVVLDNQQAGVVIPPAEYKVILA